MNYQKPGGGLRVNGRPQGESRGERHGGVYPPNFYTDPLLKIFFFLFAINRPKNASNFVDKVFTIF